MKTYNIEIKLLSDTVIGSAISSNVVVDTDVMFDEVGLPYIPAKRVKGLLSEALKGLLCILKKQGNGDYSEISASLNKSEDLLGRIGETDRDTGFFITDLKVEDYEENREYLLWAIQEQNLNFEEVLDYFTVLRVQTSIDDLGIAKEGSLRTTRALKSGLIFSGSIEMPEEYQNIIALSCAAIKRIGTKRNRGFGEAEVTLKEGVSLNDSAINLLEGIDAKVRS